MPQEIYTLARQQAPNQPYAGAVTPAQAFALLQNDSNVHLVDVRTQAERDWVGQVDIPSAQHHAVQWSLYPGGSNPDFMHQLAQVVKPEHTIVFLCRSGVRSHHAAVLATSQGYARCFNILEGFEGDKDTAGHRKTIGGWCFAGLPWRGA